MPHEEVTAHGNLPLSSSSTSSSSLIPSFPEHSSSVVETAVNSRYVATTVSTTTAAPCSESIGDNMSSVNSNNEKSKSSREVLSRPIGKNSCEWERNWVGNTGYTGCGGKKTGYLGKNGSGKRRKSSRCRHRTLPQFHGIDGKYVESEESLLSGLMAQELVAMADERYKKCDYLSAVRLYGLALAAQQEAAQQEEGTKAVKEAAGVAEDQQKTIQSKKDGNFLGAAAIPTVEQPQPFSPVIESNATSSTASLSVSFSFSSSSSDDQKEEHIDGLSRQADSEDLDEAEDDEKMEKVEVGSSSYPPTAIIESEARALKTTAHILLRRGNACLRASKHDDAVESYTDALERLKSFVASEKELWVHHRRQVEKSIEQRSCDGDGDDEDEDDDDDDDDDSHLDKVDTETGESEAPCPTTTMTTKRKSPLSLQQGTLQRLSAEVRMDLNVMMGRLWNNLGSAYLKTTAYEKAMSAYEESLALTTRMLRSRARHGLPGHVLAEVEVGRTYRNVGLVHLRLGKAEVAQESFQESLFWKKKLCSPWSSPSSSFSLSNAPLPMPLSLPMMTQHQHAQEQTGTTAVDCIADGVSGGDDIVRADVMSPRLHQKLVGIAVANSLCSLAGTMVNIEEAYAVAVGEKAVREIVAGNVEREREHEGTDCDAVSGEDEERRLRRQFLQSRRQSEQRHISALKMYRQALSIRQVTLGTKHHEVGIALYNVSIVEYNLGDYERSSHAAREALEVHRICLTAEATALAPAAAKTEAEAEVETKSSSSSAAVVGLAVGTGGKSRLVKNRENKRSKDRQKSRGSNINDELVGRTLHILGMALWKMGRLDSAMPILMKALKVKKQITNKKRLASNGSHGAIVDTGSIVNSSTGIGAEYDGDDDGDFSLSCASVRFHMGRVLLDRNELEKAMAEFVRVWKFRVTRLGPNHEAVATVIAAISEVLVRSAIEFEETTIALSPAAASTLDGAIAGYIEALRIKEIASGRYHVDVADILRGLGDAHFKRGHGNVAEMALRRAADVYDLHCPRCDGILAVTLRMLGDVKMKEEDGKMVEEDGGSRGTVAYSEALTFYKRALRLLNGAESNKNDAADLHSNVAAIYHRRGDYALCKSECLASLRIRRSIVQHARYHQASAASGREEKTRNASNEDAGDEDEADDGVSESDCDDFIVGKTFLETLIHLGRSQHKLGDLEGAITTYKDVLAMKKRRLCVAVAIIGDGGKGQGKEKVDKFDMTLESIANREYHLNGNREGKASIGTATNLFEYLRSIAEDLEAMGSINQRLNRPEEALGVYLLALRVRKVQPSTNVKGDGRSGANSIAAATIEDKRNREAISLTSEKVGMLQFHSGQYNDALRSFSEALHLKKLLSETARTVDVAHTMNSLANVHYGLGNLDESMTLYEEALAIKRKCLGYNHVDCSNTLSNIANVKRAQGQYEEATEYYKEALKVKKEILSGSDENEHPDIAATLSNLGDCQCKLKDFRGALSSYEEALRIRKMSKKVEAKNEVATLLSSIGSIHYMRGKYKRALEVFSAELHLRRCESNDVSEDGGDGRKDLDNDFVFKDMKVSKQKLLSKALINVAHVYQKLGDHEGALMAYREALNLQERQLKELGVTVSTSQTQCTASTQMSVSGYINDVDKEEEKKKKDALGEFSTTLRNIGLVYQDKGQVDKALNGFKAALKYKKMQMGNDNIDVAFITESIGLCLFHLGDYSKSLSSFSEALRVKKLNLGEENIDVATTLNNLANVWYTLGDLKKAMEAYAKAYIVKKSLLGEEHIELSIGLNNIASIYAETNELDRAIETYEEALRVRRKHLKEDDDAVASTLYNLGEMHAKKNDLAKALQSYEETLRIRSSKSGKDCRNVISVLEAIGSIHARDGRHDMAIECYQDALKKKERAYGTQHLEYARTLEDVAVSQIELGQYAEALKCLRRVLLVKKATLGESHKEFLTTLSRIGTVHDMTGGNNEAPKCTRTERKVKPTDDSSVVQQ